MTHYKSRNASAFSPARMPRLMWLTAGRSLTTYRSPGKDSGNPERPPAADAPRDPGAFPTIP